MEAKPFLLVAAEYQVKSVEHPGREGRTLIDYGSGLGGGS